MKLPAQIDEGRHEPLGAEPRDGGVNFAVVSEHASRIELCLFDTDGQRELRRYELHGPHDGVFHGFLPGVGPGLVYGLRAHGPYEPEHGHRFNPHKLLLDPYAREIVGHFRWAAEQHGYELGHPDGPRSFDARDNATQALKARVAEPLTGPSPRLNAPRHAPQELLLYEVHVKGFSMQHPGIPDELRGSYAALSHPAAIAHFKKLGVTTLSLLPVQYCVDEPHLHGKGLRNYWGYNTLGFFAPDPRLARLENRRDPAAVTAEFRAMVQALHEAGLEVVLDVVYNHTPEGNEFGPTLSFRGLDHRLWYRLAHDDRSRCENLTGCGNTLNVQHPRVAQFVLDSLRYWVQELGVDGFRFDLAPVLGRGPHGFEPQAAFFAALRQDPLLAGVHLIAEPWDAAYDGYQLGRFPGRFLEWNDKFRDAVRGYWLGTGKVGRGEFARRFTASSDVFHHGQRRPVASVNFVAVHDGYMLNDVVSYGHKHNQLNGEDNRDGRDGELSANFGVEGPSEDAAIRATRERVRRAMLATLLLAQGTPMLNAGDEIANSQQGNNNAYCQDNTVGWLDWPQADASLTDFVAALSRLRRSEPLLHHARWFAGPGHEKPGDACICWFSPAGHEMQVHDWHASQLAFACLLREAGASQARLALAFNPEAEPQGFHLTTQAFELLLDSSGELPAGTRIAAGQAFQVPARSLLLLHAL
ncbi:glycogen debranching protein GlgX [Pelomonas sp. SE-A7]|uniref:glycogen debranching protein GlgX n=1 Tax=Pelomonas sp. SE-A7 TaxID=3054953 RepID=UPI00259C9E99|nr:glycogen debranching protein GlgX [Pelomonas sp. SE-A7]MDM4764665.1 glycogen debranching protein GlgX [Pelomonas sp. SE-A7]